MRAGGGPGRWRGWDSNQFPFTMQRPEWWPEGEPFPPRRRYRPYGVAPFIRLIGCLFLSIFLFALLSGVVAGVLFGGRGPGIHPFFAFPFVLLLLLVVIALLGGMRRISRPMNNLIDGARRIAAGDYSTQVPESGSADIRSVAHAFNSMSARLKSIDEQRRSFLADVTHELRTPLSVIRGQAEAISDGVYPADAAHLAPILDATAALDRLVDDLRTLVQTDAGNLVLHKEPTELAGLVHDTVESFRAQAEAKGVALTADATGDVAPIDVDPARIRQVIGNLLSNSIRHTPAGGSAKVAVVAPATITVSDTGEGIDPELQPHVFERFAKGPNSSGSGLGLAIARDLVQAHGGTLTIASEPGRGTTATVVLAR